MFYDPRRRRTGGSGKRPKAWVLGIAALLIGLETGPMIARAAEPSGNPPIATADCHISVAGHGFGLTEPCHRPDPTPPWMLQLTGTAVTGCALGAFGGLPGFVLGCAGGLLSNIPWSGLG